jgi:PKD repeat protein
LVIFEGWYIDDVQVIVDQGPILPNQLPVANAGLDQSGIEGGSFTFNGTASTDPDGTIVSYDWDFGDGTFGSGISPIHVYSDNAIYTVTLTVTDNRGGTNSDTSLISISNVAPTANVGGPYSGLVDSTITFSASATDPGSDVLTYEWDFDYDRIIFTANSTGVDLTNPSHAYSIEGNKTVALQVRDDDGGISPISITQVTITQLNPPIVDSVSSSSSNRGTQFSWPHNTGSDANRLLVVGTSVGDNPAAVSNITYGVQSLLKLRSDENANADTATELWYLVNPSRGVNSISVTMTDKKSVVAGAITFSGVDQITPFSSNAGAIGAGVSPTVTISSDPNDVVVDVMALFKGSGTSSPELDQTQRWNLVAKDVEGGSSTKTGSASVTTSWTSDNTDWAISAASIKGATPGPPPPLNTPPVLTIPLLPPSIDELTLITFTSTGLDSDKPAQTLMFGLFGEPTGAVIDPSTGVFTWTPTEAQGPATFTFDVTLSDGIDTITQTISLAVAEVNVAPLPDNQSVSTSEGTPVSITLSASDEDIPVQELSFLVVENSTSGTLSGVAPNLTYTPNPNFEGLDSFAFTASDGNATSAIGTISITVSVQAIDVVEITRAEFNTRNGQLRVEATSTDPSADLFVLGFMLNNNGDGTYQLREKGVEDPGDSITVTSSSGGSASLSLNRK